MLLFWALLASIYIVLCTSDDNEPPDHEFTSKKSIIKSGANKGQEKEIVNLVIHPYVFKRKRDAPGGKEGNAIFTCIECEAIGAKTSATAYKSDGGYKLVKWPQDDAHECSPSSTDHLIKQFRNACYEGVSKNPTEPIKNIYERTRTEFVEKLTTEEIKVFLQDIPRYLNIQAALHRHRREFIPRAPQDMVNIQSCHF